MIPLSKMPVVVIMGPTASGKTALSLELAKEYNGSVISADSRQVYLGMNIGTDKIAWRKTIPASRFEPVLHDEIPHYLIDIILPATAYSAADFRNDASKIIAELHKKNRLPIIAGGTGFYARALTTPQLKNDVPPNPEFRSWAENQPQSKLVDELLKIDQGKAKMIDLKNPRRVIRALEIASSYSLPDQGGRGLVSQRNNNNFHFLKFALRPDMNILREKITERVQNQFKNGLIEEVKMLLEKYGENAPGLQTICYRELFPYFRGEITLEQALQDIITANWRYAKRQMTWLRKEPNVQWIENCSDVYNAIRKSRQ